MKRRFYALSVLLIASLPAFYASAGAWERVYYNDFGGNSASDPHLGPELTQDEMCNDLEYDAQLMNGYLITKYWDEADHLWYNGGDHTFPDNKEVGYFMAVNPDSRDGAVPVYRVKLENLYEGTKLRFTAYVANLTRPDDISASEVPPVLFLGVYNGPEPKIRVAEYTYAMMTIPSDEHDADATSLNWKKMSIEFTLNSDMDFAYFIVGMQNPEANGFDFAIDDISIEMEQSEVTGLLSSNKAGNPSFFEKDGFLLVQNAGGEFSYSISDLTGKAKVSGSTANGLIPVSSLQPGVYLVTIAVNGESHVERILLTGSK
ncbi:MAG: T9SS type A sorting domain-containing protein [Paludibacteraceae bacterium]|nr:T9SS type A sorting domain-containing protein [Paludibacteraceae bacterium]